MIRDATIPPRGDESFLRWTFSARPSSLYRMTVTMTRPKPDARFALRWLREALTLRSLLVALLVGSVLNLINQGDAFLGGSVSWSKIVLTYFVPLAVVSYGAAGREK